MINTRQNKQTSFKYMTSLLRVNTDYRKKEKYMLTKLISLMNMRHLKPHYVEVVPLCDLTPPTASDQNNTDINTKHRCETVCQV